MKYWTTRTILVRDGLSLRPQALRCESSEVVSSAGSRVRGTAVYCVSIIRSTLLLQTKLPHHSTLITNPVL
jgi:hypothetical protein